MEITALRMEKQFGRFFMANRLDSAITEIRRYITSLKDATDIYFECGRQNLFYSGQQALVELPAI